MMIKIPDPKQKFTYSFFVHNIIRDDALIELFKMFDCRLEVTYTEPDFNIFRKKLADHGIQLKEIERVPYQKWEHID